MDTHSKKSGGALLGAIIIIVLLIIGGLYLSQQSKRDTVEEVDENLMENQPMEESVTTESLSSSDDLDTLEEELNATGIDTLDAELQEFDSIQE